MSKKLQDCLARNNALTEWW